MYGKESREDGETRFYYHREERTGGSGGGEQKKASLFRRLFRMNRSTLIVLLDIIVLTVVFMIFRPAMTKSDYRLETEQVRVELSGFLFDTKGFVNCKVEALEDNSGGPVTVKVFTEGGGEGQILADTVPETGGEVLTMRFEIPVEETAGNTVRAEILLPGMDEPEFLTATLKE